MGRPYDRGFGLLAFMADALELTDEQEEGINQLLDSARLDSAVDRERMAQLREQMRDLSRDANAFDEPAAELLAMELAEIVSRMAVNGAQLRWQVRQLLTQEQLAQLENMPGLRGDRYTMSGNAEF
jgi:Spy/CpxP family protein refolding chaperone